MVIFFGQQHLEVQEKDGGSTVACDQFGNVYLSGYFQFTIDFDPGPGTSTLSSVSGWQDIFLIKLDNAGILFGLKSYGGSGIDNCLSMRIDQLNNIYCTGYFHDIVDFDPGPGIMNLPSAGLQDNYILKLDPSGDFVWVKTYGSIGDDFGTSLSFDSSNNVYATGQFYGTVDFNPNIGNYPLTALSSDGFITKLDPLGDFCGH
ncbi:MAG: hypothetical protein IPM51_12555 [Sphingobacteriaceae bacterium]|nr:hypothetical protein [Sphingobacteriaceae bacterium]